MYTAFVYMIVVWCVCICFCILFMECVFYYVRYRILSLHDVTQRHVRPYSNMLRIGNPSVLA